MSTFLTSAVLAQSIDPNVNEIEEMSAALAEYASINYNFFSISEVIGRKWIWMDLLFPHDSSVFHNVEEIWTNEFDTSHIQI